MFCPNCEAEYKEGINHCPDCDIDLVAELTAETRLHDTGDGEPVQFRTFTTGAEAEMVQEMLSKNGIRSFVEGGGFAAFPGSFSEQVVLMVDERDLTRAVQVYEAYFDAKQPAPSDEDQTEGE